MRQSPEARYVPALRFDWLTPYYDVVVGATTRERAVKRALIAQARFASGQQVLDLASGTGTLAIWIKQHQPLLDVTGVDGDSAILAIASEKARKANIDVHFDHALSYSLPYPTAHFDRVMSSLFFHHLSSENKQRTAQEAFRVLKSGGELHVADWGHPTNPLMRCMFLSIQLLDGFKNTRDNVAGKLIELFEGAGFVQVSQLRCFNTVLGTMALYRAVKSSQDSPQAQRNDNPVPAIEVSS
jgi:SAM-dependent methyltransferase